MSNRTVLLVSPSEVFRSKSLYGTAVDVDFGCGQRRRSRCYRRSLHLFSDRHQKGESRNRKSIVTEERPCGVDWRYYCAVDWIDIGEGYGREEPSGWGLGAPKELFEVLRSLLYHYHIHVYFHVFMDAFETDERMKWRNFRCTNRLS